MSDLITPASSMLQDLASPIPAAAEARFGEAATNVRARTPAPRVSYERRALAFDRVLGSGSEVRRTS